jgi:hypothetical protein
MGRGRTKYFQSSIPSFANAGSIFRLPRSKIVSAPSTRSISARSRVNSIAETKNNASKGIRIWRVIVVINSSLQPKPANLALYYCHPR